DLQIEVTRGTEFLEVAVAVGDYQLKLNLVRVLGQQLLDTAERLIVVDHSSRHSSGGGRAFRIAQSIVDLGQLLVRSRSVRIEPQRRFIGFPAAFKIAQMKAGGSKSVEIHWIPCVEFDSFPGLN